MKNYYVLPAGKINPITPEGYPYFDAGQTLLVLFKMSEERTRPTRVISTFGAGEALGEQLRLYHDQTGKRLGDYQVVGTRVNATGETTGYVPDGIIARAVAK